MGRGKCNAESDLELPPGNYIYYIVPIAGDILAATSSSDSLRLFAATTLRPLSNSGFPEKIHEGVTGLKGGAPRAHAVFTAGRDGFARGWDVQSGKPVFSIRDESSAPLLSLAVSSEGLLAIGTEQYDHQQAVVSVWDPRKVDSPLVRYGECHSDDVTELVFHPATPYTLLSGSTDGLVNIYDIRVEDEDDALRQVIKHGSVHHAGFLDGSTVYALSHDELFSVYARTEALEDYPEEAGEEDDEKAEFGDLRERLNGEYVVDVHPCGGGSATISIGAHSRQSLDLVPLTTDGSSWEFALGDIISLDGAHGEEIVRCVYADPGTRVIYTGGEDGQVKAWEVEHEKAEGDEPGPIRRKREKMKGFRPY